MTTRRWSDGPAGPAPGWLIVLGMIVLTVVYAVSPAAAVVLFVGGLVLAVAVSIGNGPGKPPRRY